MNSTEDSEVNESSGMFASISIVIATLCCYAIGSFLHIKIIRVSIEEKDLTWKIDIANSVLTLVYYGFSIFIHSITNMVPDLYTWTGTSFCYFSKVLLHYGLLYIIGHSMMISMLKYYVIVRPGAATDKVKKSLKMKFFWINLLHPLAFISIHLMITPDFYVQYGGFATVNQCLGIVKPTKTKVIQICSFVKPPDEYSLVNFLYVIKRIICIGQAIYMYIVAFNFFDIVFYVAIFQHMKRKILPRNNNISSKALSKESNNINRKKIKVNSQITAMISFLEVAVQIFYFILLGFVIKKTTFGTLITAMMLYLIILPYSFLMNTSNNKNRVVEVGWRAIFKNIMRGSLTTKPLANRNPTKSETKNNIHLKTVDVARSSVDNLANCGISLETNNKDNNQSYRDRTNGDLTKDDANKKETTSDGSAGRNKSPISDSDESCVSEILLNVWNLDERKNIISIMADNLDDESLYLVYFKHFLDFQTLRKEERAISMDLTIQDLLNIDDMSIGGGFGYNRSKKKSSSKQGSENCINSKNDFSTSNMIKRKTENKIIRVLKRSKKERILFRKDLLIKLEKCYKMKNSLTKEETFNNLIEELISLEESFIEN